MMANNIIINQALDALRASLPVGDVVSTTAVKVNCTNENEVSVKIMNVDFSILQNKLFKERIAPF